jgi:hypothetical protein
VRKTFYFDKTKIRQLAAEFPDALEAAAALDDLGLTLTNSQNEYEELCAREDVFLSGHELGDGYFVVMHRRSESLPETQPDPVPQFNPAQRRMRGEWWRRSREFHRHAARYGWPAWYILNGPLEQFLKKHFNVPVPWYLSDAQYAEAWKAVAWGPPQTS